MLTFAKQIPDGTLLFRIDLSFRQDPQTQKVGKVTGIGQVIGVLNTIVLTHGDGVRQVHRKSRRHQSINQPIPIVGWLNDNPLNLFLVGR
jgi:hypothetical protein